MNDSGLQTDTDRSPGPDDENRGIGVELADPEVGGDEAFDVPRRRGRRGEQTPPRKPAKRPWIWAVLALLAIVAISVGVRVLPLRQCP